MTTPDVQINGLLVPMHENGLPSFDDVPLAGSAASLAAKGQYLMASPTTGMATLADDATPSQICMGYVRVSEAVDFDATAGNARARVAQGYAQHTAPSTIANDAPGVADIGTPIWLAPGNAPGLLTHTGTSAGANLKNRSLLGLAMGLVKQGGTAIKHFVGPLAVAIARGVMMANAKLGGWYAHPVDGSASTTTAEKTIHREPMHGVVTAIKFDTMGTVAADASDYLTITVYKADGAAGTHVSIGTYSSAPSGNGAIAAGVPASFTLSVVANALNLLETDILTYDVAKAASGKILPVGTLRVIQKVI